MEVVMNAVQEDVFYSTVGLVSSIHVESSAGNEEYKEAAATVLKRVVKLLQTSADETVHAALIAHNNFVHRCLELLHSSSSDVRLAVLQILYIVAAGNAVSLGTAVTTSGTGMTALADVLTDERTEVRLQSLQLLDSLTRPSSNREIRQFLAFSDVFGIALQSIPLDSSSMLAALLPLVTMSASVTFNIVRGDVRLQGIFLQEVASLASILSLLGDYRSAVSGIEAVSTRRQRGELYGIVVRIIGELWGDDTQRDFILLKFPGALSDLIALAITKYDLAECFDSSSALQLIHGLLDVPGMRERLVSTFLGAEVHAEGYSGSALDFCLQSLIFAVGNHATTVEHEFTDRLFRHVLNVEPVVAVTLMSHAITPPPERRHPPGGLVLLGAFMDAIHMLLVSVTSVSRERETLAATELCHMTRLLMSLVANSQAATDLLLRFQPDRLPGQTKGTWMALEEGQSTFADLVFQSFDCLARVICISTNKAFQPTASAMVSLGQLLCHILTDETGIRVVTGCPGRLRRIVSLACPHTGQPGKAVPMAVSQAALRVLVTLVNHASDSSTDDVDEFDCMTRVGTMRAAINLVGVRSLVINLLSLRREQSDGLHNDSTATLEHLLALFTSPGLTVSHNEYLESLFFKDFIRMQDDMLQQRKARFADIADVSRYSKGLADWAPVLSGLSARLQAARENIAGLEARLFASSSAKVLAVDELVSLEEDRKSLTDAATEILAQIDDTSRAKQTLDFRFSNLSACVSDGEARVVARKLNEQYGIITAKLKALRSRQHMADQLLCDAADRELDAVVDMLELDRSIDALRRSSSRLGQLGSSLTAALDAFRYRDALKLIGLMEAHRVALLRVVDYSGVMGALAKVERLLQERRVVSHSVLPAEDAGSPP